MKKTTNLPMLLCIVLLLGMNLVYAGTDPNDDNSGLQLDVISQSPTAASLGKYGDIPISLFTGTPNISIPLWTAKSREHTVPISLSYHASGIRINDVASWVGLGWSLNAGGVITRSLKGLPDEVPNMGFINQKHIREISDFDLRYRPDRMYLKEISDGVRDGEPDIFNFNFNGYSGKFLFDCNGKPHLLNHDNFIIKWAPYPGKEFIIISPDGTYYKFAANESTYCHRDQPLRSFSYLSAWYLTEIISANKKDTILFEYEGGHNITTIYNEHETQIYESNANAGIESCGTASSHTPSPNIQLTSVAILKKIIFSNGLIEFNSTVDRNDHADMSKLNDIVIKGSSGQVIKQYHFEYINENRLYLDKLYELGIGETTDAHTKPPYVFAYDERLPGDMCSTSQDHWGFYNGAPNGTTLIPDYSSGGNTYNGADRSPNAVFVTAGMIESITYPTGGKTEFEFEAHRKKVLAPDKYTTVSFSTDIQGEDLGLPISQCASFQSINSKVCDTIDGSAIFNVNYHIPFDKNDEELDRLKRCKMSYMLKNKTENIILLEGEYGIGQPNLNIENYLSLTPGNEYEIVLTSGFQFDGFNIDASLSWSKRIEQQNPYTNETIGGVRIKNIKDYPTKDASNYIIKTYEYTADDHTLNSSGKLVNLRLPSYVSLDKYLNTYICQTTLTGGIHAYCTVECSKIRLSSNSTRPLMTTQGSHVGYTRVVEYIGTPNDNTGKSEYIYSFTPDDPGKYPMNDITSYESKRGKLLSRKDYKWSQNQYVPVKEEKNHFDFYAGTIFDKIYSLKTNVSANGDFERMSAAYFQKAYDVRRPFKDVKWVRLDSTKTKLYDETDPLKFSEIKTEYAYESKLIPGPTKITTYNSNGSVTVKKVKSVLDKDFDIGGCMAEINDDCNNNYYDNCYKNQSTCRDSIDWCTQDEIIPCYETLAQHDTACQIEYDICLALDDDVFPFITDDDCRTDYVICMRDPHVDFILCVEGKRNMCESRYSCKDKLETCKNAPNPCNYESTCETDYSQCKTVEDACFEYKKAADGYNDWYSSRMTYCESLEDVVAVESCLREFDAIYHIWSTRLKNECDGNCDTQKEICLNVQTCDNEYSSCKQDEDACLDQKLIDMELDQSLADDYLLCDQISDTLERENCKYSKQNQYAFIKDSLWVTCVSEIDCSANYTECAKKDSYKRCLKSEVENLTDPGLQLIGQMQLDNITSPVIEQTIYYKENENDPEKLISSSYTTYKDFDPSFGFNIKAHKIDKTENAGLVSNFKEAKIESGQLTRDTVFYNEEVVVDQYDEFGNILQYHTKQGNYTSYIWGYNNSYPVVKVDNATYDQLEAIVGQTNLDNLNSSLFTDTEIQNTLGVLRDSLSDAIVSIYTYDPAFGHMTTTTDPNGLKTEYIYDNFGRLEMVKDDDDDILQKNTYHYSWDAEVHGEPVLIAIEGGISVSYTGDPANDLLVEVSVRNHDIIEKPVTIYVNIPVRGTIIIEDTINASSVKTFAVNVANYCQTDPVIGYMYINGDREIFTIAPCNDYEACLLELIPCDSIFTGEGLVCPFGDASILNCSLPQGFIGRSRVDVNSTWTDWVKNDLKVSKDGQGIDYLWEIKKDCYVYSWNTGSWEPSCQGCTNYQTRDIWCERIETGDVMSDTWCSETKPAYTSACTHEKPANIVNINIQYNVINDSEVAFTIDLLNIACSNSSGEVMVELIGPDAGSHVNDIVSQITIDSQASETLTGTFLAAKPIDAYCQIKVTYNGVEKLISQFAVGEVQ